MILPNENPAPRVQADTAEQPRQLQPIVSSKGRSWPGLLVEQFRTRNHQSPEHSYDDHSIFIQTAGASTIVQRGRAGVRQVTYRRGDILILPMGMPCSGRADEDEYTAIHLEPGFVERLMRDVPEVRAELLPQHKLQDPFIVNIGDQLLGEAENPGAGGRLYVESLATALALRLIRRYSSANPGVRESRGALAPRLLRRVTDHIDACLHEDMSLAALAGTTGLSVFHFARQFKQATGRTPHAYIAGLRIARAQTLLRTTTLPIAEIALRCGCASQQHFSTLFRRLTGDSPSAWRRARTS